MCNLLDEHINEHIDKFWENSKLLKVAIAASVAGMISSTAAIAADPTFFRIGTGGAGGLISLLVEPLPMAFQRLRVHVLVIRVANVVSLA